MSTDISEMNKDDAIGELERLVFTAARDWRRTVKIDRSTRDMIVHALKETRLPTMASTLSKAEQKR